MLTRDRSPVLRVHLAILTFIAAVVFSEVPRRIGPRQHLQYSNLIRDDWKVSTRGWPIKQVVSVAHKKGPSSVSEYDFLGVSPRIVNALICMVLASGILLIHESWRATNIFFLAKIAASAIVVVLYRGFYFLSPFDLLLLPVAFAGIQWGHWVGVVANKFAKRMINSFAA